MADQYEIHVGRSGRWKIEGIQTSEADAVAGAKRFLAQPGVEGVKVIKEARTRFGQPTTVFEQAGKTGDSGVVAVGPIEAAPSKCQTAKDLYSGAARQTIGKLLKNYTAKMNITVGEILYNARELKRVMEKDSLMTAGVARVASLQTEPGAGAAATNARRDELFKMLDQVVAKANAVEKTELPSVAKMGFAAVEQAVATKSADAEQRDYLLRVAISRDLINERSIFGKLDNALTWAGAVESAKQILALDDFIADTLSDATVIRDLLGRRDNLLQALFALLDLREGKMVDQHPAAPAPGAEGDPVGERLNKLIGAARLPGASEAIAEHLRAMIASKNPLVREATPEEEQKALRALLERFVPITGLLRLTPDIMDALIERGARALNMGGEAGRKAAAEHVIRMLAEPARKLRFILAFQVSRAQSPLAPHFAALMQQWLADTQVADGFYPNARSPTDVLRAATTLFYQVRDCGLPPDVTTPVTAHIEKVLYNYVEKQQILKIVDDQTKPLRARAHLLMNLCLPDMLPPGKVVEAARTRVVEYLRAPDFMAKVVADITDLTEKDKALRALFDLMQRAGFR